MRNFLIKNKYHIGFILVISSLACILCIPFLKRGFVFYSDLTPTLDLKSFWSLFYPLWNENGSFPVYSNLTRLPLGALLLWLIRIFKFSVSSFNKIFIFIGFILVGVISYFSFYFLIKNYFKNISLNIIAISSFLSALFYLLNPFSINMSWGYLWFCYGLLPGLITLYVIGINKKAYSYIFILAFLWAVASLTPHYIFYIPILLISFFIFESIFIFIEKRNIKKIVHYIKKTLILFVFYFLFSAFWVIPYLYSTIFNKAPAPYRLITSSMIDFYSRNNYFFNLFRGLAGAWLGKPISFLPGNLLNSIWITCSFVIPILIFSTLLTKARKKKIVLYFSSMSLLLIALSAGTNSPFSKIYSWLVFKAPFIKNFNWLFRAPHRISGPMIMFFSFLLALSLAGLLNNFKKRSRVLMITSYLIILFLISYPTIFGFFRGIYKPQEFPKEYYETQGIIDQNNKSVWFPPLCESGFNLKWMNPQQRINSFYDLSFPSYSVRFDNKYISSYLNYLYYNKFINNDVDNLSRYLGPLNVSNFIYHNDLRISRSDDLLGEQRNDTSVVQNLADNKILNHIKSNKYLDFFKVENCVPKFNIVNNIFLIDQGYNSLDAIYKSGILDPSKNGFLFLKQNLNIGENISRNNRYYKGIILKGGEEPDLLFDNADYLLSPVEILQNNEKDSWTKTLIGAADWRKIMERTGINNYDFDYDKGIIYSQKKNSFEIPFTINQTGNYDFYIRLLFSDRGGSVTLANNGQLIETINTKQSYNRFKWYKISNLEFKNNKNNLTISNNDGLNAVNMIALYKSSKSPKYLNGILKRQIIYTFDRNDFENYRPKRPYLEESTYNTSIDFAFKAIEFGDQDTFRLNCADLNSFGTWSKQDQVSVENLTQENANLIKYKFQKNDKEPNLLQLSYNVPKDIFHEKDTLEMDLCGDDSNNDLLIIYKKKGSKDWVVFKTGIKINWMGEKTVRIKLPDENAIEVFQIAFKGNKDYKGNLRESELKIKDIKFINVYGSKLETKVKIFKNDNYKLLINFNNKAKNSPLLIKIGNYNLNVVPDINNEFISNSLYFEEGEYRLSMLPEGQSSIKSMILISEKSDTENNKNAKLSIQKINSARYKINVQNINNPFILSFAESYDPLWFANINDKEIKSLPLYSVINGFPIGETGNFEVTIEYKPQRWFNYGAVVSGVAILFCIGYLIYDWRKRKQNPVVEEMEKENETPEKPQGEKEEVEIKIKVKNR